MSSNKTGLQQLETQIDDCLLADQFRLKKRLHQLQKSSQADPKKKASLQQAISQSIARVEKRQSRDLKIEYPQGLPVSQQKDDILSLLQQHQVVIVAGETGSGKTTQLPKICLEAGLGRKAMIGHTQPRRLAASSVAARIAEEMAEPLGESVGYQVRFTEQVSSNTLVKLMTDGILLAEIASDPYLEKYDALIIDEAHERSLNIDFLLGYLKRLLKKRSNLKLLVTSATIDVAGFSRFFDDAPVVEVSGKTWPVDVSWFPAENWRENELASGVVEALEHIIEAEEAGETPAKGGDVLVFLPGEREIRDVHAALKKAAFRQLDILPLYARLGHAEQQKVFRPSKSHRRIVLATNVAETSLTVPGIHYVIDSGLARVSRYSYRNKLQQLPVEMISQASASQRAGRCGRVGPGIAIRLYDEQQFQAADEYTDPEIQRTNLASVILRMEYLRLGHVQNFPFIQPPDKRQINDGYRLLQEISAVDDKRHITDMGKQLAQLPADPRVARMLVEASKKGALNELLVIASAMGIQDPRETPLEKREQARQKHQQHLDKRSDFISLLNLWQEVEQQRQQLSSSAFKKYCKSSYLSWLRLREWREIHRQLLLFCKQLQLRFNQQPADYDAVHQSILAGLVSQIGMKDDDGYLGTRNRRFVVFPGSGLKKSKAKWLMAAELVETNRVYARLVAEIDPQWLQLYAKHLFKAHYSEPHYHRGRGQVLVKQNLFLFGLPVIVGKSVNYANVDAITSREIFIRQALVEGEYKFQQTPFFKHNQAMLDELGEYEIRQRRPDLLVDDQVLFDFYDVLLPKKISNLSGFEHWRKQAEEKNPRLLFFDKSLLQARDFSENDKAMFPDEFEVEGMSLPLSYRFHPGRPDDGVTVTVPLAILNRLDDHVFDRLVPGLLAEKIEEMLRLLPKSWRKHLVPIPDYVNTLLPVINEQAGPLHELLLAKVREKIKTDKNPESWPLEKLDDWYLMRIRLVEKDGEQLACSRDLPGLKKQFRSAAQQVLREGDNQQVEQIQRKGISSWDFEDFSPEWRYQQGGVELLAWPALVNQRDSVDLQLFDSAALAKREHWKGLARLVLLEDKKQWRYLKGLFKSNNQRELQARYFIPLDELIDDLLILAVRLCCFENTEVYSGKQFKACSQQGKALLAGKVQQLEQVLNEVLQLRSQIEQLLETPALKRNAETAADARKQLEKLLPGHFFIQLPPDIVEQLPRYLKALCLRLEKLQGQLHKDRDACRLVAELEGKAIDFIKENPFALEENPQLCEYYWMIEELRVSLFAQSLGTRKPVSAKRLRRLWAETIAK